ncbi:MAG: GC-type dockerin domain-anchored protein [Phycisphaerales bacterium]
MDTQKVLAAAAILAAAGTTFAQVSPGAFAPDATDDMESYPGARTFLTSIFAGDVGVGGALSFASVDAGDWLDFRAPGGPIAPTSGTKFGTIFGFGSVDFDFSAIGGVTAFGFQASAAGVGSDTIDFFDLGGAPIGTFVDADGYGPGDGTMEGKSWTSTVAIGSVRVDGPETAFDDFVYAQGDLPARIVLYTESNGDDNEIAAADNLGLNYDLIRSDAAALNAALASGDYVFAIIHQPANNFAAGFDTELDNFVSGGNRVHFSFWNLDAEPALQGTLGVDSTVDFFAPRPVFDNASHPSWGGAASPVATDGDDWNDNGDAVTGDEVVSTFDSASGDGATVVSNDNRTLTNAFEYDSMESSGMTDLLEAQIAWVETAPPPPPPPGSQIIQFQGGDSFGYLATAVSAAGIIPDLVLESDFPGLTTALNNPDYGVALISNPCCFFDAGTPAAVQDFLDRGNVVHLSFWNMDAEPVLQSAMGVTSLIDIFAPRSVFDNAGHPSWGSASSPVLAGADTLWNDNGDLITGVSGGASVVGTFDSTSGDGAIVIANGDASLLNSFDYDSMDGSVADLIENQLRWLPTPGDDCYADFDDDGSLTIFDFHAFQNAFDLGDLAADCDEDGILTLFDFLCFQNAFDAGCD